MTSSTNAAPTRIVPILVEARSSGAAFKMEKVVPREVEARADEQAKALRVLNPKP